MERRQCLVLDVLEMKLLRRDEHELVFLKLAEGCGQGVDRPAKFEVAAETDRQMIQPPFALADGHEIDHGLGGVGMAAVARVDDGDAGIHRGPERGAFFGVAHGDDVGAVADDAGSVGHRLALAGASSWAPAKPSVLPPRRAWPTRRRGGCGCWVHRTASQGCARRTGAHRERDSLPSGRQGREGPAARPEEKLFGSMKCLPAILPSSTNFSRSAPVETN